MRQKLKLKECDVCGADVVLTVFADITRYMCGTCKAVYFDNGNRDFRYPSTFDVKRTAFDAQHERLVQQAEANAVDYARRNLQESNCGYAYNELVQWRSYSGTTWRYGLVKDYASNSYSLVVETSPGFVELLGIWQLRKATQPLPLPVTAPVSHAKPVPKPTPTVPKAKEYIEFWTYRIENGIKKPIKTCVDPVGLDYVKLNEHRAGIMWYNMWRKCYHLFDQDTGTLLETGTNYRTVLRTMRKYFRNLGADKIDCELAKCKDMADRSLVLTPNQFFDCDFTDT